MAWNGSLNETAAVWQEDCERKNVYTRWDSELDRVTDEATNFEMIWADRSSRVVVLDLPELASRDSIRFMPRDRLPKLLEPDLPPVNDPTSQDRRNKV